MPGFIYRAADADGRLVDGRIDGESEADAVRELERKQLTALSIRRDRSRASVETQREPVTRIRLKPAVVLDFTRQLKVLLANGAMVSEIFSLLRRRATDDYRAFLDAVAADIQKGSTLSDALARHPRSFDAFYIGTIRAGEAAGVQPEALDELVKFHERRAALRRDIVGALSYPAIVVLTLIGAAIVMLTLVVPQFETVFAGAGARLPLPTRVLMAVSHLLTRNWAILTPAALGGIALSWYALRVPRVRRALTWLAAKTPFIGQVLHLGAVVQFGRMVALLERAGLPIMETLKIVEDALIPGRVRELTGNVRRQVAAGASLTAAIIADGALPVVMEHSVAVGESSGTVDEALNTAADHFEEMMRVRIKRMTLALEPLLMLTVAAMVLGVALAVFLPMWEMNSVLLS